MSEATLICPHLLQRHISTVAF